MRANILIRYSTLIIVAGVAMIPTAQAGGTTSLIQPALDNIQRQVQNRAEQMVERAVERQATQTIQQQQLPSFPHDPAELPDRLPILAPDGSEAFADVRVENDWRAVERQWLVMVDNTGVGPLHQPGIEIIDRTALPALGLELVRFRVDAALDSRAALKRILPASLVERLDRNHIYRPQGDDRTDHPGQGSAADAACDQSLTLGMVDTAIQTGHQSLAGARIVQKHFLADTPLAQPFRQPEAHGTAVASLLVGRLPERAVAPLPEATLVNASVFYGRQQLASGATLMHLVKALNWLVSRNVDVINISMAGPDNRLLATVVRRVSEQGIPMIAAVGNQGPAAPPLYPAAYPGVIGVTAVDREHRIYRWANRGEQVAFAAPGVDVTVADSTGGFRSQSGTSMATPLVAARLACAMTAAPAPLPDLVQQLASQAVDLGEAGKDPVFGYGLLASGQPE